MMRSLELLLMELWYFSKSSVSLRASNFVVLIVENSRVLVGERKLSISSSFKPTFYHKLKWE